MRLELTEEERKTLCRALDAHTVELVKLHGSTDENQCDPVAIEEELNRVYGLWDRLITVKKPQAVLAR